MKKRSLVLLVLLFFLNCLSFGNIVTAHRKALNEYHKTKDLAKVIELMEVGGIKEVIKEKPESLSVKKYAGILNDYAYFLSETDDRYEESIPIFEKVIEINSDRAVAYLNLGDVYAKIDEVKYKEQVKENYMKYLLLLKYDANIPTRVQEVINEKVFTQIKKDLKEFLGYIKTQNYTPKFSEESYFVSKGLDKNFKENFINDLKNWKNIKIVYPVYTTDDVNDKKLSSYFKFHPNLKKYISETTIMDPFEQKFYSHFNYKVYHANIDNDISNGKEFMFYSGGWKHENGDKFTSDTYDLLDLKKGKFISSPSITVVEYDFYTKKRTDSLTFPIQYKNLFLILETSKYGKTIYFEIYDDRYDKFQSFIRYKKNKGVDNK